MFLLFSTWKTKGNYLWQCKYSTSREYMEFVSNWGFSITTSSPHYPKGHGFIERQVQTIKKLLARCDENGTNYHLALQELWETPTDSNLQSPAELLFGRQPKNTLPAIIRPPANGKAIRASLKTRQDYSSYGTYSKEKPNLLSFQPIWVQNPISRKWSQGVVKTLADTHQSYTV